MDPEKEQNNISTGPDNTDQWFSILDIGNEWQMDSLYINPARNIGKITHYEVTYWGHHDESESKEYDEMISIESALSYAYKDRDAVARIRACAGDRYDEMLEKLEARDRKEFFQNSKLEDIKKLTITLSAVYIDKEKREYPGRLKISYDGFIFHKDSGELFLCCIFERGRDTAACFGKEAGRKPVKHLFLYGPGLKVYQFRLSDADFATFETRFYYPYTVFWNQIARYRNSIAEDWLGKREPWPGISHLFRKKHDPDPAETNRLFDLLLGNCSKLRPFVMERLPFTMELITIRMKKDSLSVSYKEELGNSFQYLETEDKIEILCLDSDNTEIEKCTFTYIPDPGKDAKQYKPLEMAGGTADVLKLRDPFGMKGYYQVCRSCRGETRK